MMSSWFSIMIMLIILASSTILMFSGMSVSLMFFTSKQMMDMTCIFLKSNCEFLLIILLISVSVFFWSWFYMSHSESIVLFNSTLFLFVCSMLLLVISHSFFFIFLGWEGLGLTSFILIIFYQNWLSSSGGLLTLLTNRLGDAILMLSFSYWISILMVSVSIFMSSTVLLMVVFLTMTKSAQAPFTSWLPAAMAAPTPVSALVHSSTLVTAGIWILIRFSEKAFATASLWLLIGLITLLLASMAALMESDTKKVVALSTLSQLGLMYISLYLGGPFITLFHLLMHAVAKANLFLMIGNMLHSRFAQQDIRAISSGAESGVLFLMMFISILSLSGMTFTSGFFSKDFILLSHYNMMNSLFSFVFFFGIISLTLTYCYKLFYNMLKTAGVYVSNPLPQKMFFIPGSGLSCLSLILGFFMMKNIFLLKLINFSGSGFYWVFLLAIFILSLLKSKSMSSFFKSQIEAIFSFNTTVMALSKTMALKFSSSFIESVYLSSSASVIKVMMLVPYIITLMTMSIILTMLL